ncbi:tyrosinase family protein [Neobacillus sp. LXY-4]|uniref:tyrosinase family protein n=1 Tax=Neobacillus sp. LXY-4 TaxID=3379826 RepID=UPI003EE303E3
MAIIPNFPQRFLREHEIWHGNMGMDVRSGDGVEFLEFHRDFLRRALEWYNTQGLNPRMVEPWSSIPLEIKSHPRWSRRLQQAENRITRDLESFSSSDELGWFLQTSSLHNAIHVIGSEVFNDDDFGSVSLAPRSTLFYNWHGLIDNWWSQL